MYKLNNGVEIPVVGFGTWQVPDGESVINSVKNALRVGYTHIDTAAIYDNEKGVGQAIKDIEIDRKNLFITTKLWNSDQGYDSTLKAFDLSMKKLGLDYLDLYLIHWPCVKNKDWEQKNYDTWRAFEKLYKEKQIRSIGVSNFLVNHLEKLISKAKIIPAVNQLELHPEHQQKETVDFCKKNKILCEAWSPLMSGRDLNNKVLVDLAAKYNKNVGQILIKWSLQKGFLPLPKSVTPERIEGNIKVFDFELSIEDVKTIDKLENGNKEGYSGMDPNFVKF
ncbi:MAG: aldo/keto reductase [Rickettsiales bacterium]|jgi:diketogulonate reductase-like aldo/keto reductase|nr:aldo/keto reductase [Rickettsiales bacterium]